MNDRWFHFETWVKVGEGPGEISRDVAENVFDALAEFVHSAGEDFEFDPHVGGAMNADPPEWATEDNE